jgi:hypothetical protein
MEEPNILIKTALSEAVQKVNEGSTPTEALKKVAMDLDLNPNYIQRTGEALNVALHYKHFKTASDRSQEFEIADIPAVIKEAMTLEEKTASEIASDSFVSLDRDEEVFNYTRILNNPLYKRAYIEIDQAPDKHESHEATFSTVYEKAANYLVELEKQAENADVAQIDAKIELESKFAELATEFRKDAGYRDVFGEFESQVFANHGEKAVPYLDLIYKTASCDDERGVHDANYMMFDMCKSAAMFDKLIESADKFITTEKSAADLHEQLFAEREFYSQIRTEIGKTAAKKAIPESSSAVTEKEKIAEDAESEDPVIAEIKKKASATEVVAEFVDPVVKEANEKSAATGFGGSFTESVDRFFQDHVVDAFANSFGPKETKMRKPNVTLDNMERKLLLQELMLTDPILSKVNPSKVAKAYEQLLRLSPEISKEKEVVRAELRAMVASQALSKYDAELMAKLDSGMLKRRIGSQSYYSGNVEHFRI